MIHVFREKDFFLVMIRPSSWRVNQFPTRVVIIIIMDHSYNNNNKWRLHAIFSDPRVWINRGSTMDQHGSTWISRLQPAVLTHGSCVQRPDSCVRLMAHASHVQRVRRQASNASGVRLLSRPMRQASGVPRVRRPTSNASGVPRPTRQASHVQRVRRQASHASGVRRPTRQASGVRLHVTHSAHSAAARCRS